MNILLTGATGFVGRELSLELIKLGHTLTVIGRDSEENFRQRFTLPCSYLSWNQFNELDTDLNINAVIHLAGASIAGGRWTKKRKKIILDSRVKTTLSLSNYFQRTLAWPETFLSASAIGYYSYSYDQTFDESSAKGSGFLANVCQKWEEASSAFETHSRRALLRFGLVFDPRGGFLEKMHPIFSVGLGGVIGSGKQHMSWIHLKDLIKSIIFCLSNDSINGPVNCVAPHSYTNQNFTYALAKTVKKNVFLPVPGFALKLSLGEMACLALGSQDVAPKKLLEHSFEFNYPKLEQALTNLYSWHTKPYQNIYAAAQWIDKDIEHVFPFFCEAKNLEKITPPLLQFKVLDQSTPKIEKGTIINYKLKIHGIPARWRTLIEDWQHNAMFIDTQLKGPYKQWHHTHTFETVKNSTLMKDQVIYKVPLGPLGLMLTGKFIRKDIETIFQYRKSVTGKLLK